MLKFLAKIQFSIELTMWLTIYIALLGMLSLTFRDYLSCQLGLVGKLPALTLTFFGPVTWIRWWMIPTVFFVLALCEWKFSFPKWLQWLSRLLIFSLIWITIFAGGLPFHTLCSVIK